MKEMGSLIPHPPSKRQQQFLLHTHTQEVFYGGSAGGGKTDAVLMAALQYVHIPGYAALVLRRSYADLAIPGALIPRSHEWLTGHAKWNEQRKQWEFPSGAVIQFGYLETENDKYRYQGSEVQLIAFDELTQFTDTQYLYLFSRLRKPNEGPLAHVPLRMRSASNPGGVGHEWVKRRFIQRGQPDAVFVPARLDDNPGIDAAAYRKSLDNLDPITRAQLLAGDWDAYAGGKFNRTWFRRYAFNPTSDSIRTANYPGALVVRNCGCFIAVDPAATAKTTSDYTAIVVMLTPPGSSDVFVVDVVREHLPLDQIVPTLVRLAARWQPDAIGIESSGFQIGISNEARKVRSIANLVVELMPEGKDKLVRATPAILLAERGHLYLPEFAPWLADFETELIQFTGDDKIDAHDDQVDALAYGVRLVQQYSMGADDLPTAISSRAW